MASDQKGAALIAAVSEDPESDSRIPLTPQSTAMLTKLGARVRFESGLGAHLGMSDEDFTKAGAEAADSPAQTLEGASVLLSVHAPEEATLNHLDEATAVLAVYDPVLNPSVLDPLVERKLTALALDMVPRTSYAQKMDALSSQASLAGYQGVIEAAQRLGKALPMMTTAAGTITPAKVLILGAGVAGLQAIATARRLGAQVQAYDPRPEVAEQVKSLGAKFVELDLGPSEKDEQGYAKGLSETQLEEQRRQLGDMCAKSDIVVTAAQVFGKRAPILVTDEMRGKMRAGSVVVDLAAATGGNVSGVEPGTEITDSGGVRILGFPQFAARVPVDASRMYANNLAYLIEHAWDKDAGKLKLDPGDDRVVDAVMLVQRGEKRDSGSAAKARADQEKTEQTQKEETAAA